MSKKSLKHKKNKQCHKKSYKIIAFFMAFLIIVIILNIKCKNFKTYYNNTQIIINNDNITEKIENTLLIENGNIYMSINDVKNFIDNTLYMEEDTSLIIATSNKKIATISEGDNYITLNGSEVRTKDILLNKNNMIYFSLSELAIIYDYEYNYINNSNILTIDSIDKKMVKAYANKNLKIKEEKNKSKIVDKVNKGNWLIVVSEEGDYVKVRTQNGILGYVKSKQIGNYVVEREDFFVNNEKKDTQKFYEVDITKKDISTYEKRFVIIKSILQDAIKNDNMYIKIIYNKQSNDQFERFKIEIKPILQECGIVIDI